MKTRKKHDKRLAQFRREEREYTDERARLAAIGEANELLRLSAQTRDVALVLSHWDPRFSGKEWTAVLYDGRKPEPQVRCTPRTPEWSGKRWEVALTAAITELLTDKVLSRWLRRDVPSWFRFARLDGTLFPR